MPRTLVRAPGHDRMRSLGGLFVAWVEFFVKHGPGAVQGMAVGLGDEYAGFGMDAYALGADGRRLYDHGFISRPKGTNKSGYAAYLALFEALGPARFLSWAKGGEVYRDPWGLGFSYTYEAGEPMGRPVHVPIIRILATEEQQSGNVFDTIFFNLTDDDCLLSRVPGIDPGRTRVYLPEGGEIVPSTASSASKDGGRETFCVFDETHLYANPQLRNMYRVVTRNLVKRKATSETWFIETTTMFAPGEESVAEMTFREIELILTDKKKRGRARILYDHRWGECEDLTSEEMLVEAIKEAFGEAIEWNDIQAILDEFYSLRATPADSRRYFLNAETSSSDAWIAARELDACKRPEKCLVDGDVISLGFDGSINDDSTALVACRVSDGHMELLGIWERPADLPAHAEWRVDEDAVDSLVGETFKRFRVVGFFCDPAHWQSHINTWHAKYAARLKVKATAGRPLEFWSTNRSKVSQALEQFYLAVKGQQVSFTPAEDRVEGEQANAVILRRHILNAFRKPVAGYLLIRKETPHSPRKIDACMAAAFAFAARGGAIQAGVRTGAPKKRVAKRLR